MSMRDTSLFDWESETETETVKCEKCGNEIEGNPITLVRERDDEELTICADHIGLGNVARATPVND